MKNHLKVSLVAGAALVLTACFGSDQTVQSTDDRFEITINKNYKNVLEQKKEIIANRLPGTPEEHLTLLQLSGDKDTGDLAYAVSLPLPEGVEISVDDFITVMKEQMDEMPQIKDFSVEAIPNSENQINYTAETNIEEQSYYEHCRIAIDNTITTICIGTGKDLDAATNAINTIKFTE